MKSLPLNVLETKGKYCGGLRRIVCFYVYSLLRDHLTAREENLSMHELRRDFDKPLSVDVLVAVRGPCGGKGCLTDYLAGDARCTPC